MSVLDPLPGPVQHSVLVRQGWSPGDLRGLVRTGRLVRVRRGAYVDAADPGRCTPESRHLLAVRATMPLLADDAVLSHVSAAVLHGLLLWQVPIGRVQVTRPRPSGGRLHPSIRVRTAPLAPHEVVVLEGLAVTSAARTLVDVLRGVPFEQGVVLADAALRSGAVSLDAFREALARARGWPGVPSARRVGAFADARSESVGESRSRVAIARVGLPAPRPQLVVTRPGGLVVGRCDFGWEERGVVGEFDGRVKYGRTLRPDDDQDPGDVVFEEKRREDALRDLGWEVARWVWSDLHDFRDAERRLRQCFRRADARRPSLTRPPTPTC